MTVETCAVSASLVSSTHELVHLQHVGRLHVQPIGQDPRQRRIVEHDDRVGVVRQPLEREQRVVRLHDDVAGLRVREDGIGRDQLLRKAVVEPLEQVRPESGACPAGDRVQQHEALSDEPRSASRYRTSSESLPSASRSIISMISS